MTARTVGVYNLKGGVGKTTTAVSLAWCSAVKSARKTLLWDLDPQAAASHILGDDSAMTDAAQSVFSRQNKPEKLIRPTRTPELDLLAADTSLRGLDRLFFELGKRKRLKKLLEGFDTHYDRIVLDCPPGLGETAQQVLRAADVVIVPIIPSALSLRAFAAVQHYLDGQSGKHPPLLPVFTMVDRRRALHKNALERHPDWPVIPMASAVERMAELQSPIGELEPSSAAATAYERLWRGIELKLKAMGRG